MTPLSELLQQFSTRYHKALIARAALMAGLGSGCCALLAWRLMLLRVQTPESLGVALGLVAALFISLTIWLKRRWMPQKEAAAYLDRSLGLQQRLVTAEEFAKTPGRSALYVALVDDLARQASGKQLKTMRPWNHTSGILAIALLLLLLWPQLNAVLPPGLHQPELTQQPPKQKEQQDNQQQQQQSSNSQQKTNSNQSSGANQQQQQRGAGQPQSTNNPSQQNPQSGSGSSQASNSQTGAKDSQSNQQSQGSQSSGSSSSSADQNQASQNNAQQQGQQGSPSQQAASSQQNASAQQSASQQNTAAQQAASSKQNGSDQQSAQQQNQQGQSGQQSQGAPQQNTQSKQGGQQSGNGVGQKQDSPSAREGSGSQGLGQSMGNGAELKADIQKLLKEMSSELKELQGQLDAVKDQPRPQAGSGTDPNLYGAEDKLDPLASKNSVPLQLEVDQKITDKAGHPAGGVAKSSGGISGDLPQTQAQPAQLADQPSEEAASSRQPVPVEYRSVFDQLRKQGAQPADGKNQ